MPSEPPPPDPALCDADPLARSLAALRPAPPALDVSALFYEAGRASRRAALWRWRALAAAAVGVAAWGWARPGPTPVAVAPPLPAPVLPAEPSPVEVEVVRRPAVAPGYIALRDRVLVEGVDALPAPTRGGDALGGLPAEALAAFWWRR